MDSFWDPQSTAAYWLIDLKLVRFGKNEQFSGPPTTAAYWLIDLKLIRFWSKQLFLDLLIKTPVSICLTPVQIPLATRP